MSRLNWYVPDRRIMTKSARQAAVRTAQWITTGSGLDREPDETSLFVAMHTCAYCSARRPRGRHIPSAQRAEWARRRQVIREYLVEKNLGLAYAMVRQFGSRHLDEDDLLSDAFYGLTRAVDRFNPWRGYRFSTYACNVITRGLMRRGKREGRYRRLFPIQHDTSFERPDRLPDYQTELYVERLHKALDRNWGELTDLESRVLTQRFPADEKPRPTFQEIGDAVGLSKERIRQIQNLALSKLRQVLDQDPVLQ